MSTTQKIVWVVSIVVIVIGGYWWWTTQQSGPPTSAAAFQPAPASGSTATPSSSGSSSQSGSTAGSRGIPTTVTVTFNGTSFSPANVTVAQGGTVTWVSTDGNIWVASDPHPIHNGYDGTTMQQHCAPRYAGPAPFDECAGGSSPWSFTFTRVGTWGYHDHFSSSVRGSVTVVAQ